MMKSKLISVIVATAISTIGLCSTISYAADDKFVINSTLQASVSKNIKYSFGHIQREAKTNSVFKVNSVNETLNQPLFTLSSPVQPEYIASKKFKKNELFELAMVFNDKLQQFISGLSFLFISDSSNSKQFIESDKPRDNSTIKLIGDCETKAQR